MSLHKIRGDVTFFDHQKDGVRHLCGVNSWLLADEPGLGKSLQALTVAAVDFQQGFARRVCVICPATLKWNWAEEIRERTNFTYQVLDGSPEARKKQVDSFVNGDTDILIVNYEQVKSHLPELNAARFDIVIIDESHYIKGHRSERTKAVHQLKANRFFLLSGSPVLNRVDELWGQLHRIDPISYPTYWSFVQRFAVFGGYKDKQIIGVKNQAELKQRLEAVMIRRRKEDVLDLPEKQFIRITVDLHPEQQKLYDQAMNELQITVPDDPDPMEIENALTKFLKLKQICGTTATIPGYKDNSHKLDRVVSDTVELAENGHKTILFTQFRDVNACAVNRLEAAGLDVWVLHGDVPPDKRVPVVNDWAQSAQPGAIVVGLQVGGIGLNMTAARHGLFIDELFVPALNGQAVDRFHRIGADTTQPVQIRRYICKGTVEERVEQINKHKTQIFGPIVDQSAYKKALIKALMKKETEGAD